MEDNHPLSYDFDFGLFNMDGFLDEGDEEVAEDLPLLPLRDTVVFPHMMTPLAVGRDRSLNALEAATSSDNLLVVVAQRDPEVQEPKLEDLYSVGVEMVVGRILRMPDGTTNILGQGRRRVELLGFNQDQPHIRARIRPLPESRKVTLGTEALMRAVLSLFEKVVQLSHQLPEDAYVAAMNVSEPGPLADLIASLLDLEFVQRQELLEILEPALRLQRLSILLAKELDVLELEYSIHDKVQQEVDRSQREFYLREQMRAIQSELGEIGGGTTDLQELEETTRSGRDARSGAGQGTEGARPAQIHAARIARDRSCPHLPGLAPGAALDRDNRRHPGHCPGGQGFGCQSLRPAQGQGAHPGVPGSAQAVGGQTIHAQPHPMFCRTAGHGQDFARAFHRRRLGAQVRAHISGWHPRRGRDPGAPAHLYRCSARKDHPDDAHGGHDESPVHAG